jgi:hypothetical protein
LSQLCHTLCSQRRILVLEIVGEHNLGTIAHRIRNFVQCCASEYENGPKASATCVKSFPIQSRFFQRVRNDPRPQIGSLLHPADSDTGDTMMLSLYVALGIFLLIAVRNPSAHRSLIAFAAWSSFAHAGAMSILGLEIASQRVGFLVGSAVLVVIGVALIVLAPAKSAERVSAAVA